MFYFPLQSSQFQWMLQALLDLYENHPHEDSHTVSLIVVGILKAVAVLKSVSRIQINVRTLKPLATKIGLFTEVENTCTSTYWDTTKWSL